MASGKNEQNNEHIDGFAAGKGIVSQSPSMARPKKKSKFLTWLIVIIILLAMILAGLFGWLWWRDRETSTPSVTTPTTNEPIVEAPEDETTTCPEDFSIYTNSELGVQFCYPTAWGEPNASDAKFAEADTGSRWLLGFDSNDSVHIGLVSADWTTEVARDGTCVDTTAVTMPTMSPFSTEWIIETTEGTTPASAMRGIEMDSTTLLVREYADSLLTNGTCLEGFKAIDNPTYAVAAASYFAEFNSTVTDVQQHIDNPNVLISADERANFLAFTESIIAYEE
jgi:hypothetical protein